MSVTFRLPKPLADRIDVLRKRVKRELTRTRALERLIQKGLEHDEEILRSIE